MKRKKLVVISHTNHFLDNGVIKGWGPTINEINFLSQHWEEVVHVACFLKSKSPSSSRSYSNDNITYVPIPFYGGHTFFKKIGILFKMPLIIKTVYRQLEGATEVQLRTPTAMGLFLLPLFNWFWKRDYQFWVKYAGDWEQERPPRSNGWQRWFLQKDWINFPVTINGFWPNQKPHCFSFENPCLYDHEIEEGLTHALKKTFHPPFNLIFVGRIDDVKGVDKILKAVQLQDNKLINELIIIGDGPKKKYYEEWSKKIDIPIYFKGFIDRPEVHQYLKNAHFILLPSSNEGFPKVIAEAACYGVIPIVSNVSSIKHYINYSNGYLWNLNNEFKYSEVLNAALIDTFDTLELKSKSIQHLSYLFTFNSYFNKLEKFVFKSKIY